MLISSLLGYGYNKHLGLGIIRFYPLGCLYPIHVRHRKIRNNHIDRIFFQEFNNFNTIAYLTYNCHFRHPLDYHSNPTTNEGMVISKEDMV